MFNHPVGICVDNDENVYVCDADNLKVKKIDPRGNVTTLAGNGKVLILNFSSKLPIPCTFAGELRSVDGMGAVASFELLCGLTYGGDRIYVSDYHQVRSISISDGWKPFFCSKPLRSDRCICE
jgi:hypothetical protein